MASATVDSRRAAIVDFVGFEWEEAESLAAEMRRRGRPGRTGECRSRDAPVRVIRQVRRGGVLELVTAAEAWTL